MSYKLYLGDLQFSSWSFRAILIAEFKKINFERINIELDWPLIIRSDGAITDIDFDELFKEPASSCGCEKTQLFQVLSHKIINSKSQQIIPRVPLLEDLGSNLLVYDVLAISDYLDKKEQGKGRETLWPEHLQDYGIAKGFVNHLHSDYLLLMEEMSFSKSFRNERLNLSREGQYQAKSLLLLVEQYLENSKKFMFNSYGIADIMLTPIAQSFIGWKYDLSNYPIVTNYFKTLLEHPNTLSKIQAIDMFYNGMNKYEIDSAQWISKHYRYNNKYNLIHNCRTNIIHRLENEVAQKMFELAYFKELDFDKITEFIAKTYNAPMGIVNEDVKIFFNTINPKNDKSISLTEFKYN